MRFAGGWFHSGDLGVLHPDGYIQLKDRSKDIIISGGENISSIEVEDVLYRHPAVMFAAVVAKPDEKWGETPCAFVEKKPGQRHGQRGRSGRLLPRESGAFQMPEDRDLRRTAEDDDGQDPEIPAARTGKNARLTRSLSHVSKRRGAGASVLLHSQSFEFVLQAELFFFELGDAHFVPTRMRHLRVDLLLQLLMFIREFPDVTLYGHRFNLTVQGHIN